MNSDRELAARWSEAVDASSISASEYRARLDAQFDDAEPDEVHLVPRATCSTCAGELIPCWPGWTHLRKPSRPHRVKVLDR